MKTPIVPSVTDELIAGLESGVPHENCSIPGAIIGALLAERTDLKQQLAAASVDAERWRYARADTSAGKSDICVVKKIWGDGRNYTQEIILTGANADAAIDAARNPSSD